jgi:hypothetical protein
MIDWPGLLMGQDSAPSASLPAKHPMGPRRALATATSAARLELAAILHTFLLWIHAIAMLRNIICILRILVFPPPLPILLVTPSLPRRLVVKAHALLAIVGINFLLLLRLWQNSGDQTFLGRTLNCLGAECVKCCVPC